MKDNALYLAARSAVEKYDLIYAKKACHWGHQKLGSLFGMASGIEYRLTEARRLKKFKNIHEGERCFIIGSGPSILQQDLGKLKDEVTFVTNFFALHERYDDIKPDYYCVSSHIVRLGSGLYVEMSQLLLEKTKETVKFFPLSVRPILKKNRLFADHRVYYINCMPVNIWEAGSMCLDVAKGVHIGDTLIIDFCLPLAFYMGLSEIYLLGCDCDYGFDKARDGSKGYFYDVSRAVGGRQPVEYYTEGYWTNHIMKSYSVAREAFARHNRKIYNAGVGGKLGVFERVDYKSLF